MTERWWSSFGRYVSLIFRQCGGENTFAVIPIMDGIEFQNAIKCGDNREMADKLCDEDGLAFVMREAYRKGWDDAMNETRKHVKGFLEGKR